MEKRILIAFLLSFAVLYGFQWYFPHLTQPTSRPADTASNQSRNEQSENKETSSDESIAPPPDVEPAATGKEVRAADVREEVIGNALYSATVSNRGAVLKSFRLKQYTDAKGEPIELIDSSALNEAGGPLVVRTGDRGLDERLAQANYDMKRVDANSVAFEFSDRDVHVRKTFEFDDDAYLVIITSAVRKNGRETPHEIVWQGVFGDQSVTDNPGERNAVYQREGDFERVRLGDVEGEQEVTTARIGVEDQYFLAMFIADQPAPATIAKAPFPTSADAERSALSVAMDVATSPMKLFVGPQSAEALKKVDPQLEAVLDYGWFEVLIRPLMAALLWIHNYVGNFGWAIIILTIAINFALLPLRLKQQVAMQKMQRLQPQMRTLQDRYKKLKPTDPRRAEIQGEMMALYKEHGVNPLGGCLPLLLQMPFLFAFWSMLSVSIELRRAPWILWVQDLSQPDPSRVLPVLMGVSMFVQQKMTPTPSVDPVQARMMLVMPFMLTLMFVIFPVQSGVMLYWLTGNVVMIAQQLLINRFWSPKSQPQAPSRRRKSKT